MQAPPESGSLQEWVLILTLDREEDVEHARFRALAKLILSIGAEKQDSAIEAFEDYMKRAFPSLETKKQRTKDKMFQALKSWVGGGPLQITPMAMPSKVKSRMVQRISGVDRGKANQIYSRLGRMKIR